MNRSAGRRQAGTTRQESAEAILQLLDHLRTMAQLDGHPDMADVLDEAYGRCARMEAELRRTGSGDEPHLIQ